MKNLLIKRLQDAVKAKGFSSFVVGLSGGVDSALSAAIATHALGAKNIHAYYLPYTTSSASSRSDAIAVANALQIKLTQIDITDIAVSFINTLSHLSESDRLSPLRVGNILSRVRMTALFDLSAYHNSLVLGTANKSELLLGYNTWYGDSACAINPIGDLYKTQVWSLSRQIGVPESVIIKPASADHFDGQTDEDDLGYKYELIDPILTELIDNHLSLEQVINKGFDENIVKDIIYRVKVNSYKREQPVVIDSI